MRQDRKNLLWPPGLVCVFIIVSTLGCGSYNSNKGFFIWSDDSAGQIETYYHPGLIFDFTGKERRFGERPTSSERFVRSHWPVVERRYGDITIGQIDTYQIYTDDDQRIASDNRAQQRYRYRSRTLRSGRTIR